MIEKDIELRHGDVILTGMLFIPEGKQKNPAIIIAHGLPATPLPVQEKGYDELGRKICALGFVSIIFNFSGCQGSTGFFSLRSWVKDLNRVFNFIKDLEQVNPSQIGFLAFSMGTVPTIYSIAQHDKVGNSYPIFLIICACPAALSEKRLAELRLGIHLTNELGGIRIEESYDAEILSEFREFMPIKWIEDITLPKHILHGARDDLINVKNAYKLFEKAIEPKELIILKEAGHKLRQDANAMNKILKILKNSL